jgi:hypothetical protein
MVMTVTTERITPAKAEKMLNKNHDNRKLRAGVVEKYTEDMRSGRWTECIDPIAFYEDGDIADGQHRLWSVVESGTTQDFIIVRGLDRASGLNIDVGLGRSLVDSARISGANTDLSNRLLSVCRAVVTGSRGANNNTPVSNAIKLAYVEQCGEAARWAIAHAPVGRAYSLALVLAAMARAWYYEKDKDRLAHFGLVLGKGFMADEGDSAAIALRNALAEVRGSNHPEIWRDLFYKTQNAIKYFMRHKPLKVIKSVKDEVYPLPKSNTLKKAA